MNYVTINGKRIIVPDGSVSIINDKVFVNGKEYLQSGDLEKATEIRVVINGTLELLETSKSISLTGDIKGNVTALGSINCDRIGGDVYSGGSVSCDNVGGNVFSDGSVSCDDVGGNVTSRGSVSCDTVKGKII